MSLLGRKNVSFDSEFDVPVMEGYDVHTAGDVYAHHEFIQDMVGVYESMHAADMAEIETRRNNGGVALESCTTGLEELQIVQEGAFNNVTTKLKEALKKLWAKIKGFFQSIRKYFDYLFMNGKDFAKKYQTDIVKAIAKADENFKFEMYKYDDSKIDSVDSKDPYALADKIITQRGSDLANKDSDAMEKDVYKPFRASLVGGSGDKEDFSEDVFAYFRNGATQASDKEEIKASAITGMIKTLTDSKTKSALDKLERNMNKSFEKQIKEVEKFEKELVKGGESAESIRECSKTVTAFEACQAISSTFIRAWHGVVKERASAYKSACMKVMAHRNKKQ